MGKPHEKCKYIKQENVKLHTIKLYTKYKVGMYIHS